MALAAGLIPKAAEQGFSVPLLDLAGVLVVFLLLVGLIWHGGRIATAAVAPATLIMLHLALTQTLHDVYDPAPMAQVLAQHQAQGLGITDAEYHGQFTFAGRLAQPISLLNNPATLSIWAQSHPGGVLLSRTGTDRPVAGNDRDTALLQRRLPHLSSQKGRRMTKTPDVTVVLPAKDEADCIAGVLRDIGTALADISHEIVLVDDGSSDGTGDIVLGLRSEMPQTAPDPPRQCLRTIGGAAVGRAGGAGPDHRHAWTLTGRTRRPTCRR